MKKLIRKAVRERSGSTKVRQIRGVTNAGTSGSLEQEANRLRQEYPSIFHPTIDKNLEWVRQEMDAVPGSVSVQEGMLALSNDLPPISRKIVDRKRDVGGK